MIHKIAIDASRAIRFHKTGVEWYAFRLIEALAKIAPSEWKIYLLSDRELPPSTFNLPASWISRVLRWPPRYLWSQVRLAAHLRQNKPDLFFSPVHVLPFFASSPAVVTIHDVDYMVEPRAYSWKGRNYLRLTTAWAVRRATRIITPSEATKKNLQNFFSCPPEKIRVTALAPVVRPPAAGETRAVLEKMGIREPYFIAVGRIERKKNTAGIINAFKIFHEKYPEPRLILAGRFGRGHQDALSALTKANLGDRVVLAGQLTEEKLGALISGAIALVFPSIAEGFGLPILDAFSLGVPVITSKGIATEEAAGDAALLVNPRSVEEMAEAMTRVYENQSLQRSLIEKGRDRVRDFSWENTARRTVEVFQEILQ